MSKETTVILLGLWVVIVPYLGLYFDWIKVLMVLTGIGLMLVGFLLRGEALSRSAGGSPDHPFVESDTPADTPEHEQQEGIGSLN